MERPERDSRATNPAATASLVGECASKAGNRDEAILEGEDKRRQNLHFIFISGFVAFP
jgi:hypothetical protein